MFNGHLGVNSEFDLHQFRYGEADLQRGRSFAAFGKEGCESGHHPWCHGGAPVGIAKLLPHQSNSSWVYGLWMFMDVSPVYSRYIMVYHGISWYIEVVHEGF
jgi:hypothetical protein